jgi:predicted MFS family arabinose efflux permease
VELALAVVGVAFIASNVVSAEVLGKVRVDLRLICVGAALFLGASRAAIYLLPLPVVPLLGVLAAGSLIDGGLAVALRMLIASYEVEDSALSMAVLAASDNVGQATGGVLAGAVLAAGGCSAVGELVLMTSLLASWLPVASRVLRRVAVATPTA